MNIIKVTVGYELKVSLLDYCNVSPSLQMTAMVGPSESVVDVHQSLLVQTRQFCEDAVDDELESAGESPRYYEGPLYRVYHWNQYGNIFIVPNSVDVDELPGNWTRKAFSAQRLDTVMAKFVDGERMPLNWSLAQIREWWGAQEFYQVWALKALREAGGRDLASLICVRTGLDTKKMDGHPGFVMGNHIGWMYLIELEKKIEYHYEDMPYIVVDGQQQLDQLVDEWIAAHPQGEFERDLAF